MNFIKEKFKSMWNALKELYGAKEEINSAEDCERVKQWNKKIKRMYITRTVVGVLLAVLLTVLITLLFKVAVGSVNVFITVLYGLLFIYVFVTMGWGKASMKLHRDEVKKDLLGAAKLGYKVGSQFETTHYTINHEFGDTYRVTSRTDNDGCLYAVIGMCINYMVWITFCIYRAPFITYKKYKDNLEQIKRFEENKSV